jgi:hypothetical protein
VDQNSMEEHPRTKWLDRDEDHSHDVMNTAKLVTTFAAGIAAAFVGAGLQQGTPTNWDKAATALLCVTLLATICVLLARKETLDIDDTQTTPTTDLHQRYLAATKTNRRRAEVVYYLMLVQVGLATLASGIAIYPFLAGFGLK